MLVAGVVLLAVLVVVNMLLTGHLVEGLQGDGPVLFGPRGATDLLDRYQVDTYRRPTSTGRAAGSPAVTSTSASCSRPRRDGPGDAPGGRDGPGRARVVARALQDGLIALDEL